MWLAELRQVGRFLLKDPVPPFAVGRYAAFGEDEYTKKKLESMGIRNVINTGCATLWQLTPDFCAGIPSHSASEAVTTLTDYRRDPQMINRWLSS